LALVSGAHERRVGDTALAARRGARPWASNALRVQPHASAHHGGSPLSPQVLSHGRPKLALSEVLGRPLTRAMLASSDVHLLALPGEIWIWIGAEVHAETRQKAMLYAQSFLHGKGRSLSTPISRVVESAEPAIFTSRFVNWHVPLGTFSAKHAPMHAPLVAAPVVLAVQAAARAQAAARMGPPSAGSPQVRMWRVTCDRQVEVLPAMHGLFDAGELLECP